MPASFTVESPRDEADGTPFYLYGPGQATIFTLTGGVVVALESVAF
jgi:hypothetical protein